jgi:hypothetical protein
MPGAGEDEFPGSQDRTAWSPQEIDRAQEELGLLLALASSLTNFEECWQSWKADHTDLPPEVEDHLDELAVFARARIH